MILALETGNEILVILFCDQEGHLPDDIVAVTRARCSAPLVLFRDSSGVEASSEFDFIIPNLTPPADWLRDIAAQIERNRCSQSQEPTQPAKVLPIDAPANKIRLLEREDSAAPDSGFERLSPSLEGSAATGGNSLAPRCFI